MPDVTITTYDLRRDLQLFRRASYVGGEDYRYPRPSTLSRQRLVTGTVNADGTTTYSETRRTSYLVPFPAEDDRSYDLRLALATYVNVVAPIVDAYARGVTSGVTRELGDLEQYADDIDARGTSWPQFVESIAAWTEVYGELAVVVDAPSEPAPDTAADDARRPYCVLVSPAAWAWTRQDDRGQVVEFAYVEQALQEDEASSSTYRVRVLTTEGWQVRKATVGAGASLGAGSGEVLASGKWPAQIAGKLPVVFSFFRRDESSAAPRGISLVGDVCDIARAIYNRRSWADTIAREAGFPTLAIPMADTGGQLDAATRIMVGTSKAMGFNSGAGAPSWIQPSSEWFERLHARNAEDFRLCLRITGVDSDGDAGAASSGEALRIRSRDFESQARSFARSLHATELAILRLYATWAGVNVDGVRVSYPSRFVLPDRGADFDRALKLLKDSPVELGVKAKARAAQQLVTSALPLDDAAAHEIAEEIRGVLEQDAEEYVAERSKRMRGLSDGRAKTDRGAEDAAESKQPDRLAETEDG
jgi:hypothetical protein